jgi:tRNA U34 5-carboxymethylaminomethyl modifying enzyme MnmG/GidA
MDAVNHQYQKNNNNNKKLSKVLSTKLSIDDYNAFLTLTKLEYQVGLIKEESTSELLRFTIRHILNQVHNQPEYLVLKQEQQQQKEFQNNQQQQKQHHSQAILPSTTSIASHPPQVSSNISSRNNLVGQKMTRWKLSSLLSR